MLSLLARSATQNGVSPIWQHHWGNAWGKKNEEIDAFRSLCKPTGPTASGEFAFSKITVDTAVKAKDTDGAQVAAQQALIAEKFIRAPFAGRLGVRQVDLGQYLSAGTMVVTLQALDPIFADFYLPQQALAQVKVGQAVKLRTDSFPDKTYSGKVTFIASEAEFTPKQIQTKEERVKLVYRIKIDVDNSHQELKNNMPVDGEILL